jgi:WG containing repeat
MKLITSLFIFLFFTIQSAFCNDTTNCLFPAKLDNKWGFIDNNQILKIPYQFDSVGYFSENLALAEFNGLWGYINDKGTFVIKPQFKFAESFSCGLAKVSPNDPKYPTVFINKDGSIAFRSKYRNVYGFTYNRAIVKEEKNIFYLDKTGKVIIKTKYPYGDLFNDGIALVWSSDKAEFIDTSGQRIAFFNEMGHQSFSEGLASVLGNGKTFYIDKFGNKVKIVSRSFYINKLGQPVITNTVDSLVYFPFYNGIAEVCVPGVGHKSGFIDTTGKLILPVIYDRVDNFFGEYTTVYREGKGSIINKKGEVVADIKEYDKYFPKYTCH